MNTQTPKRICLVAMPWSRKDRPSAALGALAAYLRLHLPQLEVECRHEFLKVAAALGFPLYDALADSCYGVGELLYSCQLYPERGAEVRSRFMDWAAKKGDLITEGEPTQPNHWGEVFDSLQGTLIGHRDELASAIAGRYEVVGLTCCFGQLFANLSLARKIKEIAPHTCIVLGGSTISSRVGPSIMEEYPFVDYVVQGEGERPLAALLEALAHGDAERTIRGVLSRSNFRQLPMGAPLWEVENMDELPFPQFDEYESLAEQLGIGWVLPIEGSRGCWWDRVRRTGDPKNACYFCNLNVQWNGYRQKSSERIVQEMHALSDKHRNLRLYFLDNIIRASGVVEFAQAIQRLEKEFDIFYEMRANIKPYEFLMMKEAGLTAVQFGIESLSSALLKRIGKGTTTIQNLQAMKLCYELGIKNYANLIADFPGSTTEEVEETRRNLVEYAMAYQPLSITNFSLGVDSTVDALRERFGITNVRNADSLKAGLPEPVWQRLRLMELDFERKSLGADWAPVREAVEQWQAQHKDGFDPVLRYQDGGSFITITDERHGQNLEGVFSGLARDVFMYCMEIRTLAQISRRFPGAGLQEIQAVLERFVADKIMFPESGRYLSLAMAPNPQIAARRIRRIFREEQVGARVADQPVAAAERRWPMAA